MHSEKLATFLPLLLIQTAQGGGADSLPIKIIVKLYRVDH